MESERWIGKPLWFGGLVDWAHEAVNERRKKVGMKPMQWQGAEGSRPKRYCVGCLVDGDHVAAAEKGITRSRMMWTPPETVAKILARPNTIARLESILAGKLAGMKDGAA